ncbi:MAG: ABC transporter substrate-binding protein [Blastocatellia bacterium]|nr:ABC transporter substrate-binding protein [Blastocatellia bacterium]
MAFALGLFALTFASIVPRDLVEADPDAFSLHPVGTGPFAVRSVDEDRIVLDRFEAYRDKFHPFLDGVDFLLHMGADESLDGVLSGEYAFTKYIPRNRLAGLLSDASCRSQLQSITQPHCQYLLLNHRPGRLSDPRVRSAIAHAIDRERLLRVYAPAPVAVLASGLVPPSCPGYDPDLQLPEYDPERAKALLDASDFDVSRPIDLVLTDAPWTIGDEALEGIREDFAKIGLQLQPRVVRLLNQTRRDGDYDIIEASWYGDYLDPDTFTFGAFHSTLGSFAGTHDSQVLDELFELARATTDPPSRDELYREIHRTFVEVCPAVVLLHRRDYILHSQHVDGLQLYPLLPTVRPVDLWLTGHDRG